MRKEKETVAKQLRKVQENRNRYICSSKKVKAKNFFLIRLSWGIVSLKCGVVVQRHGGANLAEKTPRWCGGTMI